jgi:hypothetical protein
VLEHARTPAEELRRLKALLKPDGVLFIALPNFSSWEAALGREHSFHLDLPRHLFHFTLKAITILLKQQGFDVRRVNFFSWVYSVFGGFQTVLNLIVPEPNLLYKQWPRRPLRDAGWGTRRWLLWTTTYFAAPFALAVAAVLSTLSAYAGRSGTMEIEASHAKGNVSVASERESA